MVEAFTAFERIVRIAHQFTDERPKPVGGLHPFEKRNVHPRIPQLVRELFDNGRYAQATFEAYKFIDNEIQRFSASLESGFKLMMLAFAAEASVIQLTPLRKSVRKMNRRVFNSSLQARCSPSVIPVPMYLLKSIHLTIASTI